MSIISFHYRVSLEEPDSNVHGREMTRELRFYDSGSSEQCIIVQRTREGNTIGRKPQNIMSAEEEQVVLIGPFYWRANRMAS